MFGFLFAFVAFFSLVVGFSPTVGAQESKNDGSRQKEKKSDTVTPAKVSGSWTTTGEVSFDGDVCKLLKDCKIPCTPPPAVSDCGGAGQPTCDVLKARRRGWWLMHKKDFEALKKRVEVLEANQGNESEIVLLRETIEKIREVVASDIRSMGLAIEAIRDELDAIVLRLTQLEDRMSDLEDRVGAIESNPILTTPIPELLGFYDRVSMEIGPYFGVATRPGLVVKKGDFDRQLIDQSSFGVGAEAYIGYKLVPGSSWELGLKGSVGFDFSGSEDLKGNPDGTAIQWKTAILSKVELSPNMAFSFGPSVFGLISNLSTSSSQGLSLGYGLDLGLDLDFDGFGLNLGFTAGMVNSSYEFLEQAEKTPAVNSVPVENDGPTIMFNVGLPLGSW